MPCTHEAYMANLPVTTMDKTIFVVSDLTDESDEREFWMRQTPADRLLALELLR